MNAFDMEKFVKLYNNINSINEKYRIGELSDMNDESGAGGYWDLAGEFAGEDDEMQDEFYALFKNCFLHKDITGSEFVKKYADLIDKYLKRSLNSGKVAVTVSEEKLTQEIWELTEEDGFFKGAVKCELFSHDLDIEDSKLLKKFNSYYDIPAAMRARFKYSLNPKLLKN